MATGTQARTGSRRSRALTRRRMSGERRDEMLQRLEDLFLTEGFAELTVDDIAARLQCSKSTLYAVASSKEQLVVATMKHFFRQAADRIEGRTAEVEDPRERIAAYLASIGEEMRRMSRECYEDVISFEGTEGIYRLNTRAASRRVRELIQDGVQAGAFRPIHAEYVAESVALLIEGIMDGRLLDRTGLSSGDAYSELSTLVLNVLESGVPIARKRRSAKR